MIKVYASDTAEVCIDVRDTGIGMSEDELSHLFESFNRLHAENSGIEGTGMGLVITRQLAELMKGKLTVISNKEHGSCFTLSLPAEQQGSLPAAEVSITQPKPVLILSRSGSTDACCPEFEASLSGVALDFAENGIAFLERVLQSPYSLMVCELDASEISSEELLGYLADAGILADTAIIFIASEACTLPLDRMEFSDDELGNIFLHVKGAPLSKLVRDLPNNIDKQA